MFVYFFHINFRATITIVLCVCVAILSTIVGAKVK